MKPVKTNEDTHKHRFVFNIHKIIHSITYLNVEFIGVTAKTKKENNIVDCS